MIRTVYILGAGASYEVDLPLGAELTTRIASDLNLTYERGGRLLKGSSIIDNALRRLALKQTPGLTLDTLVDAARHISGAMPLSASIDNFIDSHRNNDAIAICGKLAIVTSILAAERRSRLIVDESNLHNTIAFERLADTWLRRFFQSIQENCTREELPRRLQTITLIVFNYDRCVEHFLYHAFQTTYRLNPSDAAELVQSMEILHPYGVVAPLPWQESGGTPFGGSASADHLPQLAEGIKTFTEGRSSGGTKDVRYKCQDHLAMAHRFVFLGFAFHPINMEFLFSGIPSGVGPANNHKCYATFYGRSKRDAAIVTAQLDNAMRGENNTVEVREDLTCAKLFDEYSLSLSLARR